MGRPYYRRVLVGSTPSWVSRVELEDGSGPVIHNLADLVWVVNLDSIELHPWLSRDNDVEHLDLLVFDLDPGPNLPLERLCEAAVVVRDSLPPDGTGVLSEDERLEGNTPAVWYPAGLRLRGGEVVGAGGGKGARRAVELASIAPDGVTVRNVMERLDRVGDVAAGLLKSRQKLPHL
jgi:DNA primase